MVIRYLPKQFTVRGSQFFLKMCPPFVSLLVSAHFHWPCSISIHLSPRSVTAGVRPFPLAMQHFYSCVSQVCHWWCPPFSAGRVAFLFICLPGLSLLVSAHFHWRCDIYIHLSPRSVTGGVRPFPLAMEHFCSFVSQVCHCWCPPFSAGHVTVLFICFSGLSLLVSALFRWPRNSSIHLFLRSVTAGVRPFPLAIAWFLHCLPIPCMHPCDVGRLDGMTKANKNTHTFTQLFESTVSGQALSSYCTGID